MNKKIIIAIVSLFMIVFVWAGLTKAGYVPNFLNIDFLCPERNNKPVVKDQGRFRAPEKPVIYLYSETKQDVAVQLDFKGKIIAEYPKYDESLKGWKVTAYPGGKLVNHADNREYSYLFWEGNGDEDINWDMSKGFVVKGGETREFLQEKLADIGLAPKEYNEFIVYWYPRMKNNSYNLVSFAGEQYTKTAPLKITPKPDSLLRVFMVFKPLDKKIEIQPQIIQPFERNGFTVVEWGGTEIN